MKYLIEEIDFTSKKRNSLVVEAQNTPEAKEIADKNQSFNGMLRVYDEELNLICTRVTNENDWERFI